MFCPPFAEGGKTTMRRRHYAAACALLLTLCAGIGAQTSLRTTRLACTDDVGAEPVVDIGDFLLGEINKYRRETWRWEQLMRASHAGLARCRAEQRPRAAVAHPQLVEAQGCEAPSAGVESPRGCRRGSASTATSDTPAWAGRRTPATASTAASRWTCRSSARTAQSSCAARARRIAGRRSSRCGSRSAPTAAAAASIPGRTPRDPAASSNAGSGSIAAPRTRSSKWRCGPVADPVAPTRPTG